MSTVYGQGERAEVGYNTNKRGWASYLLLGFEGRTQDCWGGSHHPGDTNVCTEVIRLLQRAFARLSD